jgi:hypothetical protein
MDLFSLFFLHSCCFNYILLNIVVGDTGWGRTSQGEGSTFLLLLLLQKVLLVWGRVDQLAVLFHTFPGLRAELAEQAVDVLWGDGQGTSLEKAGSSRACVWGNLSELPSHDGQGRLVHQGGGGGGGWCWYWY